MQYPMLKVSCQSAVMFFLSQEWLSQKTSCRPKYCF